MRRILLLAERGQRLVVRMQIGDPVAVELVKLGAEILELLGQLIGALPLGLGL